MMASTRPLQGQRSSAQRTGAAHRRLALVTKCEAGGPSSRKGGQFSNDKRRRGRPAHLRSPYDTPLRDGNRDRLMGLLTARAAKTLMCYLMETNVSVYHWLASHYKANPIPQEGNWDEVSGEAFLRTLLSMPTSTAKYDLGRDSLFDNIASCEVDPRSMAQRIMEIRSQLAEEFVQDLKQVAEENSLLLRESLQASLANMLSLEDLPATDPAGGAQGGAAGADGGPAAAANVHPEMRPSVPRHPEMEGYGSGDEDLSSSSKWKWPPPGAGIGQPGAAAAAQKKKKPEDEPPPPQNYDHSNWRTIVSLDLAVSGSDAVQHTATPLFKDSAKLGGPPLPTPPPKIKLPGLFEDDDEGAAEGQQPQGSEQGLVAGAPSAASAAGGADASEADKLSGLEKLQQRFAAELEASKKDRPALEVPLAPQGSAIDNLAKAIESKAAAAASVSPAPAAPEVVAPTAAAATQPPSDVTIAKPTTEEAPATSTQHITAGLESSPAVPFPSTSTDSSSAGSTVAAQVTFAESQTQQQAAASVPDAAPEAAPVPDAAPEAAPAQPQPPQYSPIVARVGNDDAMPPADPSGQAFEWPLAPHMMAELPADIIEVLAQVSIHGGPLHPEIAELLPPSLRGVVHQQANKWTNKGDNAANH